jgi:hypothetical protein
LASIDLALQLRDLCVDIVYFLEWNLITSCLLLSNFTLELLVKVVDLVSDISTAALEALLFFTDRSQLGAKLILLLLGGRVLVSRLCKIDLRLDSNLDPLSVIIYNSTQVIARFIEIHWLN